MTRVIKCQQDSDFWIALKAGRISGSGVPALLAPPTTRQSTRKGVVCPAGTEAQETAEYRRKLVVERITGRAVNNPTNRYMRDGTDREPYARAIYAAINGVEVIHASSVSVEGDTNFRPDLAGFALHPTWDWFGASPDGLVGEDGGIELKSPSEMTHAAYSQDISLLVEEYKGQCLSGLICYPEREWWDLASFHPDFPSDFMLLQAPRFHRSDWAETIALIEDKAQQLDAQVEAELARRGFPPTVWSIVP